MILQYSSRLVVKRVRKELNKLRNMSTERLILTKEVGQNAVVSINRPKSLNAMTAPLQLVLLKIMKKYENEKSIVIIKGEGDKAFSAGGDLLLCKEGGMKKSTYLQDMILYVNANAYLMSNYKIPIIALMNGITFGGGAGYAVCAKYKIATEKTRFSMPEAKIAFYPNTSATYFFTRSPGKLGYYLGLTGSTLTGADVVGAGYATHFCHSANLQRLEKELLDCRNEADIEDVLNNICENRVPEFSLVPVLGKINEYFSEQTVEDILSRLKEDELPWAKETLNSLNRFSPTSLKVILRQLQKGEDMNLVDCLVMESSMFVNFFEYPDVYEGIRVVLQDRNDTPTWNPSKLSEVTEELIEGHFTPVLEEKQKALFKEIDERT